MMRGGGDIGADQLPTDQAVADRISYLLALRLAGLRGSSLPSRLREPSDVSRG